VSKSKSRRKARRESEKWIARLRSDQRDNPDQTIRNRREQARQESVSRDLAPVSRPR
jgi:hypothetical protein